MFTRKNGILLVSALMFMALVFIGCSTDTDPEPDPWGTFVWQEEGNFELGTVTADIDGTDGRYKETPLGNLIADGIAEYTRHSSGEQVDFALHNGQNLKVNKLSSGKITNADISGTIGTDTLYLVSYTGEEITTLINIFVNSNSNGKWNANCIALVSKEVSYTILTGINPPIAANIKVNGSPIELAKTYRVAVGNFIGATTADQNRFPEGTNKTDLGPTKLSEAVAQYIYVQGTISPPELGRITGTVPVIQTN
ncbi:MAG: 5'-nucleotidase C-terminal domain-containing protein [Treponema sp.]|jgi:5'-nucleotidase|nr:5'-nucleotidase C-terminal domain-containing protein [Treponema sp.]